MRLIRRLRYWVRQRSEARALAEEMELHRAMAEEARLEEGMSREEAQAEARRSMGNATLAGEAARRIWLAAWVESGFQDLRYGARALGRDRSFTAMALLALVLGIGLNTSLFAAINAILFRPWNVPEPGRMIHLLSSHPRFGFGGFPLGSVPYFNANSETIEGAYSGRLYRMALDETPGAESVQTEFVSGRYFDVLRPGMALGRTFGIAEDVPGAPEAVAVLSHFLWTEKYAADPAIVGRTIRLDSVPFTVIGVAAESFGGTSEDRTDVWAPLAAITLAQPNDPNNATMLTDPNWCCSGVSARLRPGVTRERAQAELNALYRQFSSGAQRDEIGVVVTGTAMLDHPQRRRQAAPAIAALLLAVGSILLLACANVSNLLLARAAAREREIAVRVAIGAGRWRVIRQLLTESLLLASLASVGGLLLAYVLPELLLSRLMGQTLPTNLPLTPDDNVVLYAMGIGVMSALAFGLAPALRSTRIALNDALKRQSAHASPCLSLRGTLLGVQVAISVALLVAAGLTARALQRAGTLDLGFRTEGVTALRVALPPVVYDAARQRAFFDDLLAQLQAGGEAVGMASLMPLGDSRNMSDFVVPGVPATNPGIPYHDVTAGYFEILQIPILAGRNLRPEDRARGAILVNESLARLYWPDRSPVGQSVTIGGRAREVIGVVRDSQLNGIGNVGPVYFAPFTPNLRDTIAGPPVVLVPSAMSSMVTAAVRVSDANALVDATPLSEQVDRSLGDSRGIARMAGALGLLALLLATVGVYGVISYSVEQRRREIGVRMALGARPRQVVGLVLRKNARAVGAGLVVGLAVAVGESVALRSELYGLSPLDPFAYGGVLLLLAMAGLAASVIPARRAARTDAVTALHHE